MTHLHRGLLLASLATALSAQYANPAMNTNMQWQMQQQANQSQRMMQLQSQMWRNMQMQQMQMQQQMQMRMQDAQMRKRAASEQARQQASLDGAARREGAGFLPPVIPRVEKEGWRAELSGELPCFDGTHLVGVASRPSRLRGLDVATGKTLWEQPMEDRVELQPVPVGDAILYGTRDYRLYVRDAATGVLRHTLEMASLGGFTFSAKKDLPRLLFPAWKDQILVQPIFGKGKEGAVGIVYAFDLGTGQKLWEDRIEGGADLTPVIDGERVLVGGAGRVKALDLRTGKAVWEFRTSEQGPLGDGPLLGGRYHVVAGGRLVALDAAKGVEAWSVPYQGQSLLQGEGDRLIHTELRGVFGKTLWVVALDARTGQKAWEAKAAETRTPWVQEGRVICNDEKTVLALDLATGKERWRYAMGDSPDLPWCLTGEALYVVGGTREYSHLCALNLKDGALLWEKNLKLRRSNGLLFPTPEGFLFPGEDGALVLLH